MSDVLIKPTIGRRIWYWPGTKDLAFLGPAMHAIDRAQPFDAGVIFVWSDSCVNLQVTDHAGGIWFREKVRILQEGESDSTLDSAGVAQWMHYQVGQAAREAERASEKAVSPPEDTATHQTSLSETAWREANIPKASNWPRITGVSREPNYSRALTVYFERTPTDDELRAFHDYLRSAPGTWVLAQTKAEADAEPDGINLFYAGEFDNEDKEAAHARRYAATCLARNSWRNGWAVGWAAHGGSPTTIAPHGPFPALGFPEA